VTDDLSGLDEAPATVAVVVTQVAAAGPLAALCAIEKVAVDVVPSTVGALAVLRDPAEGAAVAGAVSRRLGGNLVVQLERREERISAVRWTDGVRGDELPAGLVLSDAPAVLEDLLLGSLDVAGVEGVVSSVGMSRWRAMRLLASSARAGRR
jgi:hypothetical protein